MRFVAIVAMIMIADGLEVSTASADPDYSVVHELQSVRSEPWLVYGDDRDPTLIYFLPDHLSVQEVSSTRGRDGELILRVIWGGFPDASTLGDLEKRVKERFGGEARIMDLPLRVRDVAPDPMIRSLYQAELRSSFRPGSRVATHTTWVWEIRVPGQWSAAFVRRVSREEGFVSRVSYDLEVEGRAVPIEKSFILAGLRDCVFRREFTCERY